MEGCTKLQGYTVYLKDKTKVVVREAYDSIGNMGFEEEYLNASKNDVFMVVDPEDGDRFFPKQSIISFTKYEAYTRDNMKGFASNFNVIRNQKALGRTK